MGKTNIAARKNARRCALQALYQWQMAQTPINELLQQFRENDHLRKVDFDYFDEIVTQVINQCEQFDSAFAKFLDRPVEQLDPIEIGILRLGSFELIQRLDIPYRVVLNEAIELAKAFGAQGSHKYVNSVLDQLAQQVRRLEQQVNNSNN
ncbi:MAG: transcription antitermination factor NusB [Gammaproteobacteria bacterium]